MIFFAKKRIWMLLPLVMGACVDNIRRTDRQNSHTTGIVESLNTRSQTRAPTDPPSRLSQNTAEEFNRERSNTKYKNVIKSELVELKESFGATDGTRKQSIVPYYYFMGREASFAKINAAIDCTGCGPRTFLRADIHTIMMQIFENLKSKPHIYVYGEGSWGGIHQKKNLRPHRTHSKGLYLDFFIPVTKRGKPSYFPTSEKDLFGYLVNFDATGKGEGKYKDLSVDWLGLQRLVAQLCTQSGAKLKKILIAQDMYAFVRSSQQSSWKKFPTKCRKKIKGIGEIGPYRFAGKEMMVDHDDHIHIEFQ